MIIFFTPIFKYLALTTSDISTLSINLGSIGLIPEFCRCPSTKTNNGSPAFVVTFWLIISTFSNGISESATKGFFEDFAFLESLKISPVADLIKQTLKLKNGSGAPKRASAGKLTAAQVEAIAQTKLPDLNASSIEAAMNIVAGTARSMGIKINE